MQINITLDTKSIGGFLRSRVFAGLVGVGVLAASTHAFAIIGTPTHVFQPGDPISASDVNENFTQLFEAANLAESNVGGLQANITTVETNVSTLQTNVSTLQTSVTALEQNTAVNSCFWKYEFVGGLTGTSTCPVNTFALTGSCGANGGTVGRSTPAGIAGGAAEPVTDSTGWTCRGVGASSMDVRALCCPM